jgi:hypothetical protein
VVFDAFGGIMKLILVVAAIGLVTLFAAFGTVAPCGMLREAERKSDGLAAMLPDTIVDAALTAKYGSLTPGKCVRLLLSGRSGAAAATVTAASQQQLEAAKPSQASPSNNFSVSLQQANAAMGECRAKRLRGELKSHVEGVKCSNPRVLQEFSNANYRYMDLVQFLTAKRLEMAKKLDQGQMTDDQAVAEGQKLLAQIAEIERSRDIQKN